VAGRRDDAQIWILGVRELMGAPRLSSPERRLLYCAMGWPLHLTC
jgi:hypothetical protein